MQNVTGNLRIVALIAIPSLLILALTAWGAHAYRVVAFFRHNDSAALAVVVPRLTAKLGFPATGKLWKDTTVDLPAGRWQNVFTGAEVEVAGPVRLSEWLGEFPVGCLLRI